MSEPIYRYALFEGLVLRCQITGIRMLTEAEVTKKSYNKPGDFIANIRLPYAFNDSDRASVPETDVFFEREAAECALKERTVYTVLNDSVVAGFLHGKRVIEPDDLPGRQAKNSEKPNVVITGIMPMIVGENASLISIVPRGRFPINNIHVPSKQVYCTYEAAQKLLRDAQIENAKQFERMKVVVDLNLRYDHFEEAALKVLDRNGAQTVWRLLGSIGNETADASWMRAAQVRRELKGRDGFAPQTIAYEWLKAGIATLMPRLTFIPHLIKFSKKGYTEKGPDRMHMQLSPRGRMRVSGLAKG